MAKVSLRAYNREIEAMIDRNHLDEAVAHCQHILKTFPKHVETYRLLGKAYLEARRHDEAVDIFTRVLAAVPDDFVAHVGMSIIRDEQNKLDDAIWHMERAYEVQSANPAIQAELQRLYGRREGVQPPRVRMTRGALAHMYMRGELYPQAISESKGVLEEDPGRSDMQVLLAKAYYKSGQKKDAADAASAVLKRYPFCLDANLVLAEILGADRPESAQGYRQRVVELDPYASQSDNLFHAAEVSDAAISLDRLDWTEQPAGMMTDWRTADALSLDSGISAREEQPDWMKSAFEDETPLSAPTTDSESQPALPADDIPDFLKAAGWGASTGAFDESKSSAMFDEESAPAAEPLAQGDLPDWIKAMKPAETSQPAEEQAEELPDWINKIGTSDLPVPSAETEEADWTSGLGETAEAQPPAEQPDWLKGLGEEQPAPVPAAGTEDLDWLKELGEEQPVSSIEEQSLPAAATDDLDWLKELGEEQPAPLAEEQPIPAAGTEDLDWLKELGQEEQPLASTEQQSASAAATEDLDWLKDLEAEEQPVASTEAQSAPAAEAEDLDWLKELGEEQPVSATEAQSAPDTEVEDLDWLKELGQEEQPVPAAEEQPDWLKDLSAEESTASQLISEFDFSAEMEGETPATEVPSAAVDTGSLGASEKERDDSFAWLEALAAKQGATEGLLTTPEERLEEEPDWVKQAKGLSESPRQPIEEVPAMEAVSIDEGEAEVLSAEPGAGLEQPEMVEDTQPTRVQRPPVEEAAPAEPEPVSAVEGQFPVEEISAPETESVPPPTASVEELGKSEAERDDSFAWLEALAAKQGASEGLLTKPEERLDDEPEWVRKLKRAGNALKPAPQKPAEPEPVSQVEAQPPPEEAVPAAPEPASQLEVQPTIEEAAPAAPEPGPEPLADEIAPADEIPAWIKGLDEEEEVVPAAPEPVSQLEAQPTVEEAVPAEPEPVSQLEAQPTIEEAVPAAPEPVSQPKGSVEELGRSEAERDDSFAWLEALAAKQGASEGLLTKPEERLEQEPEWVKQVKKTTGELHAVPETAQPVEEEPVSELEVQPPAAEEIAPEPELTAPSAGSVEELGKSEAERDDSFAWLEALAAKQGATEGLLTKPEERLEEAPEWVKQAKELREDMPAPVTPPPAEPEPEPEPLVEDVPAWVKGLGEVEEVEPEPVAEDETTAWLRSLDEAEEEPVSLASADELPAWMQEIEREEEAPAAEPAVPTAETELPAESAAPEAESAPEELPAWLHGLVADEQPPAIPVADDLPAWMRDATGEVVAEPTKIEPTRSSDWAPLDETAEAVEPPPPAPQPAPEPKAAPAPKAKKPKKESAPEPYREPVTTIRGTGMLSMPVDPLLASARNELSRSNIPGALDTYGKLIKKGRFLEEVIFDLREALYRYPVEVSIWQALGDAYMRANRLQDALDAYTKAEELLR